MKVRCPGCGKVLNVPESLLGKKVRCPGCKAVVDVTPRGGEDIEILPIDTGTGREAMAAPAPAGGTAVPPDELPGFCPQCQSPLPEGAVICVRCGTNVVTMERLPDLIKPSRPKSRLVQLPLKYIVPAAFVALVGMGGYFVYRGVVGIVEEEREAKPTPAGQETAQVEPEPEPEAKSESEPEERAVAPEPKPAEPAAKEAPEPRGGIPENARAQFEEALAKLADPIEKPIAINKIRNLGGFAPKLLVQAVEDEDPLVRRGIAEVMGVLRNEAVVPGLAVLIEDPDESVRRMAVGAMSFYRAKAIEICVELLSSENEFARASALAVLAKVRHQPASQQAMDLLQDSSDTVRLEAIRALGGGLYPGGLAVVTELFELLKHENMDIAEAAAHALAKDAAKAGLAVAMELRKAEPRVAFFSSYVILRSRNPKAQNRLIEVLALASDAEGSKFGKPILVGAPLGRNSSLDGAVMMAPALGSKVSPFLACCAADPSDKFRGKAMKGLKEISDKWSQFALAVSLGDPDTTVADLAAEGLVKAAADDPSIVREAAKSGNKQRAILAAAVLVAQGDKSSLDTLRSALTDMSLPTVVRGKATWFLALAGEDGMLGLFKEAAVDVRREEVERIYAAAAAAKLGAGEECLSILYKAAATGNVAARVQAIDLLGRAGDKRAGPFLLKLLRVERPAIQRGCARALGRLADPEMAKDIVESFPLVRDEIMAELTDTLIPIRDAARTDILRLLHHEDKSVKRAAVVAVGKLRYPGAAEKLIEMLRENEGQKWLSEKIVEGLQMATRRVEKNADWRFWRWVLHPQKRLDPSLVPMDQIRVYNCNVLKPRRWSPTKTTDELMSGTLPGNPSYRLTSEQYQLGGRPPPYASAGAYAIALRSKLSKDSTKIMIPLGSQSFDIHDTQNNRYYKVICYADLPARGTRGVHAGYISLWVGSDKDLWSYYSRLWSKIHGSFGRAGP